MTASGFSPPVALTPRRNRQFDITLSALLGIAIGVLACTGLVITHPAPSFRCATLSPIAER